MVVSAKNKGPLLEFKIYIPETVFTSFSNPTIRIAGLTEDL